ncbi:MAG: nicotinate-nicotinamide nucleotide adenylyltransferase [Anaerolineaceae bacterium]|nr:nicotinate-nicotinamide nucleotide adenylyltransferase [Anaerolineaceae bacterium]
MKIRLTRPQRHLIFGSSANPIHQGHLLLIQRAYQFLREREGGFERIVLMPTYRRNPVGSKSTEGMDRTFAARTRMCELAAAHLSQIMETESGLEIIVSEIERELVEELGQVNRSAETFEAYLARQAQPTRLYFLLSSDLFSGEIPEFSRWYRPERILELAAVAITHRAGFALNADYLERLRAEGAAVIELGDLNIPAVESRVIQQRIRNGESPQSLADEGLLLPEIAELIAAENLYRD